LFDEKSLQQIFDAAVRIWRQVPLRVQGTDEFMDYMRAASSRTFGPDVRL